MRRKINLLSVSIVLGLLTTGYAKTIQIPNPGNNLDIQPAISTALNTALDGDVIALPAGTFIVNKNILITKFISFKGEGIGKTVLTRDKLASDKLLSDDASWDGILKFNINKSVPSNITVTGITFRSKSPSLVAGDGGSLAADVGIKIVNCVDFVISGCRFEYFGNGAIEVFHSDTIAKGLICKNEFYHNQKGKDGLGLGYGVVLYGANRQWAKNPKFGSDNFIFIEDNTFSIHRHAIAAGGCALYVARYNTFTNNLLQHTIDTHNASGGNSPGTENYYGTRAVEIYNNVLNNTLNQDGSAIVSGQPANKLNESAITMRAGDAVIYNNTVVGYRFAVSISIYPVPSSASYPLLSQPGYLSGLALGASHKGTDAISGDGDLFTYNNKFTPWAGTYSSSVFYNYYPSLFKETRDYHLVAKPGYTPFTYPHPLLANVTTIGENSGSTDIDMNVYPNPTSGEMTIDGKDIQEIEIANMYGQTINVIKNVNADKISIDITNQPRGIYFIRIKTGDKVIVKEIILARIEEKIKSHLVIV